MMRRADFLKLILVRGVALPSVFRGSASEQTIQLDAAQLYGGLHATRIEPGEGGLTLDTTNWQPGAHAVVAVDYWP